MSYVPGIDEEEEQHAIWHDEYLYGATLSDLRSLPATTSSAGFSVVMVDASAPHEVRSRLARAAHVAQRSTPNSPAGYDGTITEGDEKLFIVKNDNRAIAIMLTALDEYFWSLVWTNEGTVQLLNETPYRGPLQKICRVWVAKAYRRRGIASSIVKTVVKILGCEFSDIGWELPLTSDGAALLRKLSPTKWWGRGDGFALEETFDIPRNSA